MPEPTPRLVAPLLPPAPPGRRTVPPAPAASPPDLSPLRPAVVAVGEKYGYDEAHAQHVARLGRQVFAALTGVHGLPLAWAGPLEDASLLHDIGYFVSRRRHHRHTRYLIRNDALLDDYPQPWRDLLALVAGNHRRRCRPGPKAWGKRQRSAAQALSAILRIADGLDYGHDGLARLHSARVRRGRLELSVAGIRLGRLQPVLQRKAGLFAETFALPVAFTPAASR